MQQQQQQPQHQGGGPGQQFGLHPPEMPPFSPSRSTGQQRISMAEAPSPISSRPPAPGPPPPQQQLNNELAGAGAVGFDEEALAAGEEGLGGGAGGNRWPRQETLALLKIRSDMDAAFRDATLKGPLWEEVSRKLAEEGYRRNAKKCKEKFENVHKYYKRTKDSRAGRNDGKTYRFFRQLEAMQSTSGVTAAPMASAPPPATAVGVPGVVGPTALRPLAEPPPVGAAAAATAGLPTPVVVGNLSFSTSNTEEYSDEDDSDDEGTDDMGGGADERGKRKRTSEGGAAAGSGGEAGSGKMMRFFEGLMKQVMERQEAMQQRFLEAIEKREQDRMIREEAWRRQEMARLAREQEILGQERAMAATRDAAVLSFIQKITGQTIPMPSIAAQAITFMPPPPPSQPHATPIAYSAAPVHPRPPSSQPPATHSPPQPQPSPRQQKPPTMPPVTPQPHKSPAPATPQLQQQAPAVNSSCMDIVVAPSEAPHDSSGYDGSGGGSGPTSSRWPKAEVHALIQLRSNLDMRYQEAGPKGPLWEEISAGMRRMGYNRSSKRCKEKWENINKYFKKVKESNKKRPEDSKTCPYFHQLEALYRNKAALGSPSGAGGALALPPPAVHANAAPQERIEAFTVAAPISQTAPQQPPVAKNDASNAGNGNGNGGGASAGVSGGAQRLAASNGGSRFVFGEAGGDAAAKKPEGIMKETTMEQRQPQPQPQAAQQAAINSYNRTGGGGAESDNMDEDDEDEDDYEDEDEEDDLDGNKTQYKIQFQGQQQHQNQHQQHHHNVVRPNATSSGGGNPPGAAAPSAPAAATTTAGSFLGMVQ
ncbi:hypothetical protein VPH35_002260 [Triticum aestivum]|uniref:Myb-like domain-containing protein n=1 Tax=Triticum aestivum TaxID=4565 RepID=A0A3B5XYU5_WHEAT|nr:trihelix transcription factor GTL1-like isoform X1 [Triticum aestivum]